MEKAIFILIPLYISYIIFIGFLMFSKRVKALKNKELKLSYFKDYQGSVPYELKVYENHFNNQFQLPVLYIITCVAILSLNLASYFTITLSYLFFLSRLAHSYFHLGSNNVRLRAGSYFTGAILILLTWIIMGFNYL